jgi:eukaryotic-like serine/threonine-protein kinase
VDDHVLGGRYRLTSLLGRGGMGAVWRARDEHLGREVAVKELRLPEHLSIDQRRTWIARLDREARAAAGLKHPGIITVHDRVTGEDGRPWIVMELVRGRSLEDLLRTEGPLPPPQVAQIGLQVLAALRAAHRAGITHRDIKPANVLLEDERVVLTDFGIAAVDGDATLTQSGAVIGTPAFMSPEQVRGLKATAASDLWSLGATLYAAVEGRPPFRGANTGAIFVAIATEDPPPAERAGPLGPTIMALLHRDPDRRLTTEQLHAQLTRLERPPAAQPSPPTVLDPVPPRPPSPQRRRPVLIATAAAVVLALAAAVTVTAFILRHQTDNDRYQANLRILQSLGTPPGTEQSVEKIADGRLRVTYTLCSDTGTQDCDIDSRREATRNWLRTQNGVEAVHEALNQNNCRTLTGCDLVVDTKPSLPLANTVTISESADGRLLLRFYIGR